MQNSRQSVPGSWIQRGGDIREWGFATLVKTMGSLLSSHRCLW
ncbi:rCG41685 [Rattus norvegicus]|uniref:RCG41685 n=1 Tax=Rattus norvegicus TaxID=10116 RepID=A6KRH2_RAT|nr:rCG41685 [Rattus norvegicus]